MSEKKYRFFVPVRIEDMPKPRGRITKYDEILKEFMESGEKAVKIPPEIVDREGINIVTLKRKIRKLGLPVEAYRVRGTIYLKRKD